MGKGIREFKDASREIRSEFENADQPRHNPNAGYQTPPAYSAPVQPTTPEHPNAADNVNVAYTAPVAPIAPPMDGGITPPVPHTEERPRLDQTTN
ncbi:hypothetical protein [Hymenobacter cellulosilyticus]|uniref:hypothetical protein n=1 Tax=Hymenobacter cellulosilyticus TaxID=2932248 RepID=UPI0035CBD7CB